ncbi:MAG TPA: lipid A deacylase LpxR family protein [Alphaproteobacteria bacterium]
MKKKFYLLACLPVLFPVAAVAQNVDSSYDDYNYADLDPRVSTSPDKKPERPKDPDAIFTIAYENDVFTGEDNNYSNGVRASYISPETDVPNWLEDTAHALPFFPEEGHSRWGFSIGQNMYTPDDITVSNPPTDDQPYAGWLYGTAALITDNDDRMDTFQVTVGMVGPASGAREVQGFIHDMIGSPEPEGWDYQLKNEPGLVLTYQRKWRNLYEITPFGFGFDFSPSVGANVGNIYTDASAGGVFRFGYDLPSDYGPPLIKPSLSGSDFFINNGKKIGWYLFAGAEGRGVARNIFLDGNTFTDSRSVDKEPFVGSAQVGAALTYGSARIAYTQVFNTREFETQVEPNTYGAVTLSTRF